MMKLVRADGASFALSVVGYQFPELEKEPGDSNWLMIRIDVNHPLGRWSATDPSLLTYELAELANWLEVRGSGTGANSRLTFIEPCLAFDIKSGADGPALLVVSFACEYAPPWAKRRYEETHALEFPLSELNLAEAVAALRRELSRFPQRAEE